jgi:hypothetical protein
LCGSRRCGKRKQDCKCGKSNACRHSRAPQFTLLHLLKAPRLDQLVPDRMADEAQGVSAVILGDALLSK